MKRWIEEGWIMDLRLWRGEEVVVESPDRDVLPESRHLQRPKELPNIGWD